MKKQYLGFNSWGNFGVNARTTTACGLGKLRNTAASTTRIYNFCHRTSFDPLACTLNLPPTPNSNPSVPSAPTITSITSGNTQLTVNFTAPTNNGGTSITDYEYSTDSGVTFTSAGVTTTPIIITGLINGTNYNVVIRAINSVGNGATSNSVSGIPSTVPNPPTSLSATNGNTQATINFTAGSNGGSVITDYEYSIDGGAYTSAGDASSPITITGLTNGVTYSITLKAVNANGTSSASSAVDVTPNPQPTIETFTTVGTTTWTAPPGVTSVDFLIVGGGGGSGGGFDTGGGGGGGGGMVFGGTLSVTPGQSYSVVVGDGGTAGTSIRSPVSETNGGNGGNSEFASIVCYGGSGGFASRRTASGTNSVGGVNFTTPNTASTGGSGGGNAAQIGGGAGGGGGGFGNGSNGSGGTGGNGGTGVTSNFTGSLITYGAGGRGANGNQNNNAIAGTSNRGNGAQGGGATSFNQRNGAAGGSGIVILKYSA
jgi:hypothetical protein